MRARMSWLLVTLVTLAILLPAQAALAGSVRPALSPAPNRSIVLYRKPQDGKPGRIWTGVLTDGVLNVKATFTTGRWSDMAVGRDTLALYDRKSGRLVTGTLKGGRFVKKQGRTIAKGYSHMAASCDSLALYKSSTGQLRTAELTSGQSRDHRTTNVGPGFDLMEASCDTLYLAVGDSQRLGVLRYGHMVITTDGLAGFPSHVAANRTSFLRYVRTASFGAWGAMTDGSQSNGDSDTGFRDWSHIAGVGDEILFYLASTGVTAYWRLVDGVLETGADRPTWKQKGLTLIAGGK